MSQFSGQQASVLSLPTSKPVQAIRPFEQEDVTAVANLYEQVIRSGNDRASAGLKEYFERIFLAPENCDADLRSLVYQEPDGSISGFIGIYRRRLRFDGRPIRMACSGQLVVRPDARVRLAGISLMRTFLQGPQELSITDGATAEVGQIWQRLGGQTAQLQSLRWTKLLCPAQFGGDFVARQSRLARFAQFATKPLLKGCDALLRRHPRGKIRSDARMELQPLTASAMSTHWPALHTGRRLRPDYDPSFFHWLLTEMNRVPSRGPLVARQVILGTRMLGWYLFYLTPERVAEVVQITFAAGQAEAVIGALLADADERNAIVVQGRLEPELTEPLARYGALMQYREPLALVHSRDEAILSAFQTGQAYLTRADGEWWAGFHLEQFS